MQQKYSGIVLQTIKHNETTTIVHFYTQERGRMAALASITHNKRSRLRSAVFQPLSIVEFELREGNGALHRIKEARTRYVFTSIPYDPAKMSVVFFLTEVLQRTLRAEECDADTYRFIEHSVRWLDLCESSIANFHLTFLIRFTKFLGLQPDTREYREGMLFDLSNGRFTVMPTLEGVCLSAQDSALLVLFLRMRYETMHHFRLQSEERKRLLDIILSYYRYHLPECGNLKTRAVLEALFS